MAIIICPIHGTDHMPSRKIAALAEIKETGELLYVVRAQCECGSYIWYEGYPNNMGITRYFYGHPDYMSARIDALNRTIYQISQSDIFYGDPIEWEF